MDKVVWHIFLSNLSKRLYEVYKMNEVYYSSSIQFEAMTCLNYIKIRLLTVIHLTNVQNHEENVCIMYIFVTLVPQYYLLVLYLTAVPVIEEHHKNPFKLKVSVQTHWTLDSTNNIISNCGLLPLEGKMYSPEGVKLYTITQFSLK